MQRLGLHIIIAHPERYTPIQDDIGIAERMAEIGCELQVSVGSLNKGFASKRKCALAMLEKGLVSYIASDAHRPEDYRVYDKINKKYGKLLAAGALLANEEEER